MAVKIVEFFGYDPLDNSPQATKTRQSLGCPFVGGQCVKTLNDGLISGACTIKQVTSPDPVIICPIRLYQGDHQMLHEVAETAFGAGVRLIQPAAVRKVHHDGRNVVVFGKGSGKELKLPQVRGRGGFFVDWVLALLDQNGALAEFVAVEVQSIDTTGNYRDERKAYLEGKAFSGTSSANPNWENVSKRILPQIIYKCHVLQLERLCRKGLFFVCPGPVYRRIVTRLGSNLRAYPEPRAGTVTFKWYDPGPAVPPGLLRSLVHGGQFITTVDQIALGFTAPQNLPPANSYEDAIRRELAIVKA